MTVVSLGFGRFSGGRIPQAEVFTMRDRWAMLPFRIAHRFTATEDALVARCGFRVETVPSDAEGLIVFEEGNWGRCKRCKRAS